MPLANSEESFVIALGMNPAWQKTLEFSHLRFHEVNRARKVKLTASGKGINFVRAAGNWGKTGAKVFQFAGGDTGENIVKYLDDEPLSHFSVRVKAPTRICTTCLCRKTGKMTELIEPSGNISLPEAEELLGNIKEQLSKSRGLALCGTFPPGITADFYRTCAEAASKNSVPVLMDAWMNILPVLEQGVDILKINSEEIFLLTEKNNMEEALGNCLKRFRVGVVAVTAGPGKAYLATEEVIYTYKLPKIEEILNPIGAGDTVSSVMFSEYVSGACPHEAFASGLAAASASCLTNIGGLFSREKAAQIKKEIEIETKKL